MKALSLQPFLFAAFAAALIAFSAKSMHSPIPARESTSRSLRAQRELNRSSAEAVISVGNVEVSTTRIKVVEPKKNRVVDRDYTFKVRVNSVKSVRQVQLVFQAPQGSRRVLTEDIKTLSARRVDGSTIYACKYEGLYDGEWGLKVAVQTFDNTWEYFDESFTVDLRKDYYTTALQQQQQQLQKS